jgi:hypothetical protein
MTYNPGTPNGGTGGGSQPWVWMPYSQSVQSPTGVYEYAPGYRIITGYKQGALMDMSSAENYFGNMPQDQFKRLMGHTYAFNGADATPSTAQWLWGQAVRWAAQSNAKDPEKRVSPWDVLKQWGSEGKGGAGGGGGGGGPRTTTSTSTQRNVQKISRSQARGMLGQALENLVGRSYSKEDIDGFLAQFNTEAEKNPTVTTARTTTTTNGSSSSSSTSSTTKGGLDAQDVVERFAKSRKDYAEYTTAVPLMDAFMAAIQSPTQGGF